MVLVAHSMGGLTQLLLMERFSSKIGLAISVAAVLTASELSVFDDATFADLVDTLELLPRDMSGFRSSNGEKKLLD